MKGRSSGGDRARGTGGKWLESRSRSYTLRTIAEDPRNASPGACIGGGVLALRIAPLCSFPYLVTGGHKMRRIREWFQALRLDRMIAGSYRIGGER